MTIREKLTGLLFLDPSIPEIIQVIDDTLAKLPEDGPIKGTDLNMVAGLLGRPLANMGRPITVEPASEENGDDEDTFTEEIIISPETGEVEPIAWDF